MSAVSARMEKIYGEDLACWGLTEDLQELMSEFLPDAGDNWECELDLGSVKGLCSNVIEDNEVPTVNLEDAAVGFPSIIWDELLEEKQPVITTETDSGNIYYEDINCLLDKITELEETSPKTDDSTDISPVSLPESVDFSTSITPPDSPDSCSNDANRSSSPRSASISSTAQPGVAYQSVTVIEPYTPPHTPEQPASSEMDLSNTATSSSSSSNPSSPAHDSKPYSRQKRHSKNVQPKIVNCSSNKKIRKRDQNRDAATRYRLKKRAESEQLSQEEGVLETKNRELKDRVDSLSSEIKYLKGLLKEIITAKIKS